MENLFSKIIVDVSSLIIFRWEWHGNSLRQLKGKTYTPLLKGRNFDCLWPWFSFSVWWKDMGTACNLLFAVFKGFCSFLMWICVAVIWGLYKQWNRALIHHRNDQKSCHSYYFIFFREMHWTVLSYVHRFVSSGSHLSWISFK